MNQNNQAFNNNSKIKIYEFSKKYLIIIEIEKSKKKLKKSEEEMIV